MNKEITRQHPIFIKYTRKWLHQVTGYSFGLLSRVATGRRQASRPFVDRCCYHLNELEASLFLPQGSQGKCSSNGCGEKQGIGQWLSDICQRDGLSLREAAAKTGLSHATIRDTIKGVRPNPETVIKLAQAFGNGPLERLALEDELLVLAGHRTPRPEGELNEALAALIDKVREFNQPRLKIMSKFADFLMEIAQEDK